MYIYITITIVFLFLFGLIISEWIRSRKNNIKSDAIEISKYKNYQITFKCSAVKMIRDQSTKPIKFTYNPATHTLILIGSDERLKSITLTYIEYYK